MNKLQKYAKYSLIATAIATLITIALFLHMSARNTQGIIYIVITLTFGPIVGLFGALKTLKFFRSLDERERAISSKASMWAAHAFIGCIALFSFISFYAIGGKGSISVVALPIAFMVSLLIAQVTESAIILVMFTLESTDAE